MVAESLVLSIEEQIKDRSFLAHMPEDTQPVPHLVNRAEVCVALWGPAWLGGSWQRITSGKPLASTILGCCCTEGLPHCSGKLQPAWQWAFLPNTGEQFIMPWTWDLGRKEAL